MSRCISNRSYPPKECINPYCETIFTPHDRRQVYCETQCRINAGNDRRYTDNQDRFSLEKFARRNSKILEFFWKSRGTKIVLRRDLESENFVFDAPYTITTNPENGRSIQWFYGYGLEPFSPHYIFSIRKKEQSFLQ